MSGEQIVKKVRTILNEHGSSDGLSIAEDRVLLEDYIKSAIPDAVVILAQKGYRVNEHVINLNNDTVSGVDAEGFISLILASVYGWRVEATRVIEISSPEYIMAKNQYTKPGPSSPVVARTMKERFVFFPKGVVKEGDTGNTGVFWYNKKFTYEDGLTAGEKEATAVCYMTAALVLGMFGDDQGKQRMSDICTKLLE